MAAWQLDLYLVPRTTMQSDWLVARHIPEEVLEHGEWWRHSEPPPDYTVQFSSLLPWMVPWSPEVQTWGLDEGHRLDVFLENGRPLDIRARIDLRERDVSFVRGLSKFAKDNDLVFITSGSRVVEPEFEAVWSELARSDAALFVHDSDTWLKQMQQTRSARE
jgi:hypothetical protein